MNKDPPIIYIVYKLENAYVNNISNYISNILLLLIVFC